MIAWSDNKATDEELVAMMRAEERLIYEFDVHKAYRMPNR